MAKTKVYILHEEMDDYGYDVEAQRVEDKDTGMEVYGVCNLGECPEDAIIGRDLVSAHEWLDYVNLGISLAKKGYDKAELKKPETIEDVLERFACAITDSQVPNSKPTRDEVIADYAKLLRLAAEVGMDA